MAESLGKSKEDYLEAILMINQEKGNCHAIDISKQLGFSKASVSIALRHLEDEGLITRNNNNELYLTEKGNDVAANTFDKHTFFTDLFTFVGVDRNVAEEDACQIEHCISQDTFLKLKAWYGNEVKKNGQ